MCVCALMFHFSTFPSPGRQMRQDVPWKWLLGRKALWQKISIFLQEREATSPSYNHRVTPHRTRMWTRMEGERLFLLLGQQRRRLILHGRTILPRYGSLHGYNSRSLRTIFCARLRKYNMYFKRRDYSAGWAGHTFRIVLTIVDFPVYWSLRGVLYT